MATTLPDFPIEGGCQCGAVRYRLTALPLSVYRCHCKDCQRFSGTTHTMSMVVRTETIELITGTPAVYDKRAESGRIAHMNQCGVCGSKLWNVPAAPSDTVVLKPGSLDDMSWAEPIGNIWTASKLPWVEIAADEPNYPGQPPDRTALIAAWQAVHG